LQHAAQIPNYRRRDVAVIPKHLLHLALKPLELRRFRVWHGYCFVTGIGFAKEF
jgi:hypothetical protein